MTATDLMPGALGGDALREAADEAEHVFDTAFADTTGWRVLLTTLTASSVPLTGPDAVTILEGMTA
jgi:hypothetical protein